MVKRSIGVALVLTHSNNDSCLQDVPGDLRFFAERQFGDTMYMCTFTQRGKAIEINSGEVHHSSNVGSCLAENRKRKDWRHKLQTIISH